LPALALGRDLDMNNRWASGEVMGSIMVAKQRTWDGYRAQGYFSAGKWTSANKSSPCEKIGNTTAGGKVTVAGIEYGVRIWMLQVNKVSDANGTPPADMLHAG